MAEVVHSVAEKQQASLDEAGCELRITSHRPVVGPWDRLRLEQVFENLLSNAMKYGAGQPIDILVEARQDVARVSFRDFGLGVPPESREEIFERFRRGEGAGEGWGLGLWIVRRIVDALGGRVWVEAPEGPGSLFVVELPLAPEARASRPSAEPRA